MVFFFPFLFLVTYKTSKRYHTIFMHLLPNLRKPYYQYTCFLCVLNSRPFKFPNKNNQLF